MSGCALRTEQRKVVPDRGEPTMKSGNDSIGPPENLRWSEVQESNFDSKHTQARWRKPDAVLTFLAGSLNDSQTTGMAIAPRKTQASTARQSHCPRRFCQAKEEGKWKAI